MTINQEYNLVEVDDLGRPADIIVNAIRILVKYYSPDSNGYTSLDDIKNDIWTLIDLVPEEIQESFTDDEAEAIAGLVAEKLDVL